MIFSLIAVARIGVLMIYMITVALEKPLKIVLEPEV